MSWREWAYVAEYVDNSAGGKYVRIVKRQEQQYAPEDDKHVATVRMDQARTLQDSLERVIEEYK